MVAGFFMLFLFYCWGMWILRIHGITIRSRILSAIFPFGVAFISLALFAGLAAIF